MTRASWVLVLLGTGGLAAAPLSDAARTAIEADWQRQEQVTRRQAAGSVAAVEGVLARGAALLADARGAGVDTAAARAVLDAVARERVALGAAPSGEAWLKLYLRARWALRETAWRSPALAFDRLLFVKRAWPTHNHQCSHRVGEAQIPGANLCVLTGLQPDGQVRELLSGDFATGGIGRTDLSFDGRRIVFPYARPRRPATGYGLGAPGHRGGACHMYDLWTVDTDGGGLTQVTDTPDAEDTEPCWLPDGRIAFTSSRDGRLVQCGDWALVCGIFSVNADGSDPRRITEPQEGEFYPSMLDDGRLLYTRWDYVMKPYNVIQQLWAVNPDGTRAQLVFGDWYSHSVGPIGLYEARQVPGQPNLVFATGAAHHNTGAGPIMLADLNQSRGGPSGLINVTPEVGYPEGAGGDERCVPGGQGVRAISNTQNATGWYAAPYPLSARSFLVCYSYEPDNGARRGYGLYWQDVHGNRELIHRLSDASCYAPLPLRARPTPRLLPDRVRDVPPDTPGTLAVSDVYRGLDGVPRGTVRWLRVLEVHPKRQHTVPQRVDLGVNCGWDVRGVLGTVPVEADGSAHFEVPAGRLLFLEALDADHLEVRRMRNYLNVMPGERVSCVGCHEAYHTAPKRAAPLAMRRPPDRIAPPAWGTGGLGFARVVQPVLDRWCVGCHDGAPGKDHGFDLRGGKMVTAPAPHDRDQGPQHQVSDAFLALLPQVRYMRVGGYAGVKLPLKPGALGSRVSPLMQTLAKGHHGVKLPAADWQALACWIDCNAPFYGSWDDLEIGVAATVSTLREPTPADRAARAERVRQLNAGLAGGRLVAFLAGGLQVASDLDPALTVTQTNGRGWSDAAMQQPGVLPTQRALTFDDQALRFALKGWRPGRSYTLGLTWWDYNRAGRVQAIIVADAKGQGKTVLLGPTALPDWSASRRLPATVERKLPAELTKAGALTLTITREGGANVVLSELWLVEGA